MPPGLAEQIEKVGLLSRHAPISSEELGEKEIIRGYGITSPGSFQGIAFTARQAKVITLPTSLGLPSVGNTVPFYSYSYRPGSEAAPQNLIEYVGKVLHQPGAAFDFGITGYRARSITFDTLIGCINAHRQAAVEPVASSAAETASISAQISTDAERRVAKHKGLVGRLVSTIVTEAKKLDIRLLKVTVTPAWSHEYEETNGVVMEAEIKGNADERFLLWDSVGERIGVLQDLVGDTERQFLTEQVSFVVTRS